jgi:hypothetical protein
MKGTMRQKHWVVAALLSASACGRGSVGTTADAGVDSSVTIRLDGLAARDAVSQEIATAADAGQSAPACHEENGLCGTDVDYCCDGFACGSTTLDPTFHCMKICAGHAECSTGCCAELGDSGITVCLPQLFCPEIFCSSEEETCGSDTPCCAGLACAVFDTTPPTSACKPICTQHSECSTGCCAELGDSGITVCLAQSFCPEIFCRTEDESCLGENPCCKDLVCAVFSTTPQTSACKPICERHEDCATGCCASLGTDSPSACLDKIYCGG